MKQKKLTIKPFLNKLLNSEASDAEGNPYYPLYYQISYNRKNTHIRSFYGLFYRDLDEIKNGLIGFEIKILRKLIAFETNNLQNPYELKGLKPKYEVVLISMSSTWSEYLKTKLKLAVQRTKGDLMFVLEFSGFKRDFDNLFAACKLLFKDFEKKSIAAEFKAEIEAYEIFRDFCPAFRTEYDFPTIMDWIDGSCRKEFEAWLTNRKKNNQKKTEILKITDKIVIDRIKNIVQ
jgi:hypothetical protein